MPHFVGAYDYDFAIAAIPIQLILLTFWLVRGNLPIRSSVSFLLAMVANLVMTVTDIWACEAIAVYDQHPLWVSYLSNMLYFGSFVIRGWALFDYAANECHAYRVVGAAARRILFVPALVVLLLTLVTPITPTIFSVTPGVGYASGPLYQSIYGLTYLYIAASIAATVFNRTDGFDRTRWGILCYNLILLVGIQIRKNFSHTLVMSYFSILAILVIYLTAQNPDLSRDRKTVLLNRHAFDLIVLELEDLSEPYSCMVITITNYEQARTLYGSEQHARSLRLCGQWLRETFADCHVFYWGGGRFVVLHPGQLTAECSQGAARVLERFKHPWESIGTAVMLQAACAILTEDILPKGIDEVRSLISHTIDHAAELNARGTVMVTQEMLASLAREREVGHALTRALNEGRIEVYLQPIFSTSEGRIVGAEALARLFDPTLGFIPPPEFINLAERNGDIMELGRQIFERVCAFVETECPARLGIQTINVNLSPAQCLSDQLAHDLSSIAGNHGVALDTFDFEVTETSMDDIESMLSQLEALAEFGATFSLDDFGTGVSNLTRLMELPIGVVKLDVGVVQAYFRGESSLLPDLVRMFRNAGMKTILEGVETSEMMEGAMRMGADFEQGYYFSRPLPPDQFMSYLEAQAF